MGIVVNSLTSDRRFEKMPVTDWLIEEQDERAQRLGRLQLSFARHRVVNVSDATKCYPRRFALLASTEEHQKACLAELKALDKAWSKIKESKLSSWVAM